MERHRKRFRTKKPACTAAGKLDERLTNRRRERRGSSMRSACGSAQSTRGHDPRRPPRQRLVDQSVGLEETDDGIWAIYFNTLLIATLDERDYIIRG